MPTRATRADFLLRRFWRLAPLAAALLAAGARSAAARASDAERLFDYYFVQPRESRFEARSSPNGGVLYVERHSPGKTPQSFKREKKADVFRVFILGGSTAQLYGSDPSVRPRLDEALSSLLPGSTVEVLNCGRTGYDSSRDLAALEEVLDYSPDLVVVMTGINEGQPDPPPAWAARMGRRLGGSSLPARWWRSAVVGALRVVSPHGNDGQAARLESNLRRMTLLARSRGIPLVLCAMPLNLRDMPPNAVLPWDSPGFLTAWIRMERGQLAEAASAFRRFVGQRPADAMGRYWLARTLDRLGAFEEAREQYIRAQDLAYALPRFSETVRRVAEEEGAIPADLAGAFAGVSEHGLPGRDLFEDDVHWYRLVDPLVTMTIAKAMAGRAREGAGPVSVDASRERRLRARAAAIERSVRSARLSRRSAWTIFRYRMWEDHWRETPALSERLMALLETIGLVHPRLLEAAADFKPWLKAQLSGNLWDSEAPGHLESWWPELMAHVGEVYRRQGRYELALRYFDGALLSAKPSPLWDDVRLCRALALLQSGEGAAARRAWSDMRQRADSARGRVWQAYLESWPPAASGRARGETVGLPGSVERLMREGDRQFATRSSEEPAPRAAASVPLVEAGIAAFRRGDLAGALQLLDRAVQKYPADFDALMTRGALRTEQGEWALACEDFDAVLRLLRTSKGGRLSRTAAGRLAAALSGRATALQRQGREKEAAAGFKEALDVAPAGWSMRNETESALHALMRGGSRP